ncbi:MAG: hypothetical protein ACE14O_07260 [Candidatus Cloacimonadaceae bacterium]
MDFGERLEFFLPSLSDLEFFLPSLSDLEFFLPPQPIVCHDTIRQNGLQRALGVLFAFATYCVSQYYQAKRTSESDIK